VKLSDTAGKLLKATIFLTLIIIASGFAYYRSASAFPFAAAAISAAGINTIRIWSLDRGVSTFTGAAGGEGKNKSSSYFIFVFLLRFILTGAAIAAVALNPFLNIWGLLWGVAIWPVAVFASRLIK